MKNKKLLLLPLILLLIAVAAIVMKTAPTVDNGLRISELLKPMLESDNRKMHLVISLESDGEKLTQENDIYLLTEDGITFAVLEGENSAVYLAENLLILENGKAFRLGEAARTQPVSLRELLPQIATLYDTLKIRRTETEDKTVYSVDVAPDQADELLSVLSMNDTIPTESIHSLKMDMAEYEGKLQSIVFFGSGRLEGKEISLQMELTGFRVLASGDYPVPETVKKAAETADPEGLFSLTEDLYRLVMALGSLADADGTLELKAECGSFQLAQEWKLSDLDSVRGSEIDPDKLQELPEILGWLCMEGDVSCTALGDAYEYALKLDASAMNMLAEMLLPEMADYGEYLTEGSVTILLSRGKITSMEVSIAGKIPALLVQIPVTLEAVIRFF